MALHKLWGDQRLTLRYDHPFWRTHFPPNGWGCMCRVVAVEAPAEGDATEPPAGWDAVQAKTGTPAGIDKGWDSQPAASADHSLQQLVDDKLIRLDGAVGAAMYAALRPVLIAEKTAEFGRFVDDAIQGPARGRSMIVGALKPPWAAAATRIGSAPVSSEIAVRDADVLHTFRSAKVAPLDPAWYRLLPVHLDAPAAVVLDTTHSAPAFLLFFDVGPTAKKLVIQINYKVKKTGTLNVADTGKIVDVADVRGMLGKGYKRVEGSL